MPAYMNESRPALLFHLGYDQGDYRKIESSGRCIEMNDKRRLAARELKRDFEYRQITLNFLEFLHSVTPKLWNDK
jgi:hypothetical protein